MSVDLTTLPFSTNWLFKDVMHIEIDGEIKCKQLFGGCFSTIYQIQLVRESELICSVVVKLPSGDKLNSIANASKEVKSNNEKNEKAGIDGDDLSWEDYSALIWLPFSHQNECRAFEALKELDFSEFPAPKSYFTGFLPNSGNPVLVMQDLTAVGKPLTRFYTLQIVQDIAKHLAHLHAFCFKTTKWCEHFVGAEFDKQFSRFWSQIRKIYTIDNIEQVSPTFANSKSLEIYFDPPKEQRKICNDILVHGDLYPTNILTLNNRVTGILDMQFSHLGQPAEDLAMITTFLDNAADGKEPILNAYWNELTTLLDSIPFAKSELWKSYDDHMLFAMAASLLIIPFEINDDPPEHRERIVQKGENLMKLLIAYDRLRKSDILG